MRALAIPAVLLFAMPSTVCAQMEETARARAHFDVANGLYALGKYREAIAEFTAGYALGHKPRFLLNLGQCYRKLNDFDNARKMYERYLEESPPSDPMRQQVLTILSQLPRVSSSAASAPASVPETLAPGLEPAPIAAPAHQVTAIAPSPSKGRSFLRKHWWIFPTAAVVVTGVAVGIYFGVRSTGPKTCVDASDLACFSFGP